MSLAEPVGDAGVQIYPAFEGWGPIEGRLDTSCWSATSIATRSRSLDIPIGPDNRIEPGGPDLGQPTHFLTGRS